MALIGDLEKGLKKAGANPSGRRLVIVVGSLQSTYVLMESEMFIHFQFFSCRDLKNDI